jgi:hypothetical protein
MEKRPLTYMLPGTGCTIEVAPGGKSAKATRHFDKDGNTLKPPEVKEFKVIEEKDAPTPQVQAERWAKGKEARPALTLTNPEAERVAKVTAPKKKN